MFTLQLCIWKMIWSEMSYFQGKCLWPCALPATGTSHICWSVWVICSDLVKTISHLSCILPWLERCIDQSPSCTRTFHFTTTFQALTWPLRPSAKLKLFLRLLWVSQHSEEVTSEFPFDVLSHLTFLLTEWTRLSEYVILIAENTPGEADFPSKPWNGRRRSIQC